MSNSAPLRVYCDFNDGDDEAGYWILYWNDRPLEDQIEGLGLKEGSEVILFQDDNDFEVPAVLRRGLTGWGKGEEGWLALPDWSKRIHLS